MAKKTRISDLREHLFETLEALKDSDSPMELDRAKAICEVAQTIINSAKVEVEFAKAVDASIAQSSFFAPAPAEPLQAPVQSRPLLRAASGD
jgi:hypothetical protein